MSTLTETASGSQGRDRYADLLRIGAIGFVVLGHWLAAVILVQDGALQVGRIHVLVPWTQWTTWAFQVMPIFFIVGGFVNARSWTEAEQAGEHWSTWLRRRTQRLLTPLAPLLIAWALLVPVLLSTGLPREYVHLASQIAFVPIWFLGVYLLVIALVPFTWQLHVRYRWRAILAFALAAAAVDASVRQGATVAGYLNYVLVWAGIHQFGYFWHEDRLPRPAVAILTTALAAGALAALVTFAGYPVSMVALELRAESNASPPTVALLALGLAQLGLVVAAGGPVRRWLERPRAWKTLTILGSVAFTVFLWHMTAMLLAAVLAYLTPLGLLTPQIDARWWLFRPAWILLCAAILAVLVVLFKWADRGTPGAVESSPLRTGTGIVATTVGISWLVRRGLYDPDASLTLAAGGIGAFVLGLGLLGALRLRPRTRERGGREAREAG